MIYAVLYNDLGTEIDRHVIDKDFTLTDVLQMWDIYVGDTIKVECDDLSETSDIVY